MLSIADLLQSESPRVLAVLLDAAIKASLVLVAAGVAAMLLRRASAALRHLVWSLALGSLLCLPVLSTILPPWRISILPDSYIVRPDTTTVPQEPFAVPAVASASDVAVSALAGPAEASRPSPSIPRTPGTSIRTPAESHAVVSAPALNWRGLLLIGWLAGALILAIPLLIGMIAVVRRVRHASLTEGAPAALLNTLCRQMGLRRPVSLLCTRDAEIPATWGLLRPVILVPADIAEWPEQRCRMVLLHELAHIRRMDWLTMLMARLVRILYWYHPLVWLASRMQRIEAEQSCDDLVLAAGLKPSDYARQLLDIVSGIRSPGYSSLAAIAMAHKSSLEGRILSILSLRQRRERLTRPAVAFAAAVMTAIILPVSIMQAAPPKAQVASDPTTPPGEAPQLQPPVNTEDRAATITASGRVTDARTGRPIAGASVRGWICVSRLLRTIPDLGNDPESYARYPYQETTTDADGQYKLTFVTPLSVGGQNKDSMEITVSAAGYETRPLGWQDVTRNRTTFENIDFAMKVGKRLSGTVVDEAGQPVDGATVQADNNASAMWKYYGAFGRTSTGPDGRFQLWVTTDETVGTISWLQITKPGYGVGFCTHVMDKESLGRIVLPKGGTVTGRVTDAEGHPQANVEVVALWGSYAVRSTTDKQGRYELKGLPGQSVIVRWIKGWYPWPPGPDAGELTVFARGEHGKPLGACPHYQIIAKDGQSIVGATFAIGDKPNVVWPSESGACEVTGRLVPAGSAFSPAGLSVVPDENWKQVARADGQGRFVFAGMAPGKHRLIAYIAPSSGPLSVVGQAEIDVEPGKKTHVEIPLQAMALAHVQVLDTQGNPLKGIGVGAVATTSDQMRIAGGRTDKDGRITIQLYPNVPQKVSAYDGSRRFWAEGSVVTPQPNQVLKDLRIVMAPGASIRGRIVSPVSLEGKNLAYVVGEPKNAYCWGELKLDDAGNFELKTVPAVKTQLDVRVGPGYGDASKLSASVPMDLKPGQQKDLGTIALKPVADTETPADSWTRYVQEFIAAHTLDSNQQQTAWSILKELKDRAQEYRVSHKAEYDAAAEISDKSQQGRELQALGGPINRMFQELKDRLMAIPADAQRTAVAAGRSLTAPTDTRPAATRKGGS